MVQHNRESYWQRIIIRVTLCKMNWLELNLVERQLCVPVSTSKLCCYTFNIKARGGSLSSLDKIK